MLRVRLMVLVEVVDAGVLEVEDADDLALVDEGDGELGARPRGRLTM